VPIILVVFTALGWNGTVKNAADEGLSKLTPVEDYTASPLDPDLEYENGNFSYEPDTTHSAYGSYREEEEWRSGNNDEAWDRAMKRISDVIDLLSKALPVIGGLFYLIAVPKPKQNGTTGQLSKQDS